MSKPTYWDLLRRPEWQRKRLEIMQRDGFACRDCASQEETLNVHHTYYTKGAKPWEYPDESLMTLCENCHAVRQDLENEIKAEMGKVDTCALRAICGYIKALALQTASRPGTYDPTVDIKSFDEAIQFCRGYCIQDVPFTVRLTEKGTVSHSEMMAAYEALRS